MKVTEKLVLCFNLQETGWCLQSPLHQDQYSPPQIQQLQSKRRDPWETQRWFPLPMFCQTFQSSMVASVKRACLGLIKKMLHYLEADMMESIIKKEVAGDIVDVQAITLDVEDDEDD